MVATGTKDFSDGRKPIKFTAEGRKYTARAVLSGKQMKRVTEISDEVETMDQVVAGLVEFFTIVMDKDNATRIIAHLDDDDDPLTPQQGVRIMQWIAEQYAGTRPLESASI